MKTRDYRPLVAELMETYARHSPRSRAFHERAENVMVDGGSHSLRLIRPFPPRITAARGAWLTDEDGHQLLDFWQGHLGNILGHNPEVVTAEVIRGLETGVGLQTGFTDRLQIETAEILCRQTGAERVRFTTSGTLSTMYAIVLARAFTGRTLVMKVGGGWHGGQPWALKGIDFHAEDGSGFQKVESDGVPVAVTDKVIVSGFNDVEMLEEHFRQHGDKLACFILEPFLGVGGFTPASLEYLRAARALTERYGVVFILDEVISGFRFRAGDLGSMYGVRPDLVTLGKIIGGGMPVAAVGGRAAIMNLAGRAGGSRVKFSGGTYSAHPASLLAARAMMTYLVDHEDELYSRLGAMGERVRQAFVSTMEEEGLPVRVNGAGDALQKGSSMFMLHFPFEADAPMRRPEDWFNPGLYDQALSHQVLDLALLVEDVFILHAHGGVSAAHTEADTEFLTDACRRAVRRIKPYL